MFLNRLRTAGWKRLSQSLLSGGLGTVLTFAAFAEPEAPVLNFYNWVNDVGAEISNQILYPTGELPPSPLVRPDIRNNRARYLTHAEIERLGVPSMGSFELTRQLNRLWTSFKANL